MRLSYLEQALVTGCDLAALPMLLQQPRQVTAGTHCQPLRNPRSPAQRSVRAGAQKANSQQFIVSPENADALADGLCALLQSEEKRKKLGEAARTQAKAYFSLEAYYNAMGAVYDRVTGR